MALFAAFFLVSPALALDWAGTWTGDVTDYPVLPGGARFTVKREIGPIPTAPGACTHFRTTYYVSGKQQFVKDYKLCRDTGLDSFYFDEKGHRLPLTLLGEALSSAYHDDDRTIFTSTRVRGDVMEEEIYSWKAEPAAKGIVLLQTRSLRRLLLHREK